MTPLEALSRRWASRVRSSIRLRRNRVKSRRARMGLSDTKLGRTKPTSTSRAIQSASATSVLRPGTLCMYRALSSHVHGILMDIARRRPAAANETGRQAVDVDGVIARISRVRCRSAPSAGGLPPPFTSHDTPELSVAVHPDAIPKLRTWVRFPTPTFQRSTGPPSQVALLDGSHMGHGKRRRRPRTGKCPGQDATGSGGDLH